MKNLNPDRKMNYRWHMIMPILLVSVTIAGCSLMHTCICKQKSGKVLDFSLGPPSIIYKTRRDYSDKVPVTLSEDRTMIISYPHPKDLYYLGQPSTPVKLRGGYLLDNRGIGVYTCFIDMTYQEFSSLDQAPDLAELDSLIIDRDPILEMYDCGNRNQYIDAECQINYLIRKNMLSKCKKIK